MGDSRAIVSPEYRRAARVALAAQIPLALICMLVLDAGRTAKACGYAMAGFWVVAAIIALRRPWSPTAGDLWYWKWGFFGCLGFALLSAAIV